MTPEEIKRYFEATPPPQEVELKPWARITDSSFSLKAVSLLYTIIKETLRRAQPGGI